MPIRNVIVFESIPDVSDNTQAVFDEMLKRNIQKKYKLVWVVSSRFKKPYKEKNVIYINPEKNKFRWRVFLISAKALISCNGFLKPVRKKQLSFYLSHGMPVKSVRNYYTIPSCIDYAFSTSEQLKSIYSYELNFNLDKIISLGFPRNDALTNNKVDVKGLLNTDCKKIIVWYPTFRQHSCGLKTGVKHGLPVLHDANKAIELNETAKQNGVLIVLKPHFVQDLSYIKDLRLSNIRFINDDFYKDNGVSSYSFVGSCDALISDYSSIYFDFLLCDKPIALVWEDLEEYKREPGLINDYEYWLQGAEKIYTLDDFKKFIVSVAKEKDLLKKERTEICKLSNFSKDGKNSERVVDFILEKIKY